jgi:hypothetical protein
MPLPTQSSGGERDHPPIGGVEAYVVVLHIGHRAHTHDPHPWIYLQHEKRRRGQQPSQEDNTNEFKGSSSPYS